VSNDPGARHFLKYGITFHAAMDTDHDGGQSIQECREEERVHFSGRLYFRREDILPKVSHALYMRVDIPAFFGELRRFASELFELGYGSEMLLKR